MDWSLYAPMIVRYRDSKTDAKTALEKDLKIKKRQLILENRGQLPFLKINFYRLPKTFLIEKKC